MQALLSIPARIDAYKNLQSPLVARDPQLLELTAAVTSLAALGHIGVALITGPSGVGKTAVVKQLIASGAFARVASSRCTHYFNCLASGGNLVAELCGAFRVDSAGDLAASLRDLSHTHILVLDEIDTLAKRRADPVLRIVRDLLFGAAPAGKLVIVGIANETAEFDTLQAELLRSPYVFTCRYAPYTAQEITEIVHAVVGDAVDPKAVAFVAEATAKKEGDVRYCYSLLTVGADLARKAGSATIKLVHVAKARDCLACGSSTKHAVETMCNRYKDVCLALLFCTQAVVGVRDWYAKYSAVARKIGAQRGRYSEFLQAVSNLVSQGIIRRRGDELYDVEVKDVIPAYDQGQMVAALGRVPRYKQLVDQFRASQA